MATRDSYTISTGNGDPLSVIVSDGTDSFRGTLASTDCSGILFNPAHAPRIIEQLIAQRAAAAKSAAAKSAGEADGAENIIIERTAIARQIRIVFKASAVCLGNITVQDKLSMILDKFDPCAVPASLEDAHKFALAIQKESRATADALHDQSSVIAALGARIAELGIVVDKLLVRDRDAPEKIAQLLAATGKIGTEVEQLQRHAKVYDDSGILTPIRYRFFEKHPDGIMPMIPLATGRCTIYDTQAKVMRACRELSRTRKFISIYFGIEYNNNLDTSTILVIHISSLRDCTLTIAGKTFANLKHIVVCNHRASDGARFDVSAWTNKGIQVHVNQAALVADSCYSSIVECDWNNAATSIASWHGIINIMKKEYREVVAAWNAFEPEFIDAYLAGMI